MSSLRNLKSRIKSVESTRKLTTAMKTVATAKYNAISSRRTAYGQYKTAVEDIYSSVSDALHGSGTAFYKSLLPRGTESLDTSAKARKCFVLLTGNRGLCGSYNSELLKYFTSIVCKEDNPLVIVCGKWGALRVPLRFPGLEINTDFVITDLPDPSVSEGLTDYLINLYTECLVGEIVFVYQRFVNTLTHTPVSERFLPLDERTTDNKCPDAAEIPECLPSPPGVLDEALRLCLSAGVYGRLLSLASGFQSATLVAMRTASDNSEAMLAGLELKMNRLRQSGVTTEVIEVSGGSLRTEDNT